MIKNQDLNSYRKKGRYSAYLGNESQDRWMG